MTSAGPSRKLTLADISDLRAYEREREAFRSRVIALKRRRRVEVGPIVTLVFENRDTIRFQVQEMARVEKLITDEAIAHELDTYNPLVPEPGELSATLFVELTSEAALREWLPRLVGIERSVRLVVGGPDDPLMLAGSVEAGHESQLTREDITASVHYVGWRLDPEQVARFVAGPVRLVIDHPAYHHEVALSDEARAELTADLVAIP